MITIFWIAVATVALFIVGSIVMYVRMKPRKDDPDDYDTFA